MADQLHILTLIIEQQRDIPRVRDKIKLLTRALGCPRLQVTRLATAASEISRLLETGFSGGKVRIALVRPDPEQERLELEMAFSGRSSCTVPAGPDRRARACPLDRKTLLAMPPLPALAGIFPSLQVEGGLLGAPLSIRTRSPLQDLSWGAELLDRIGALRRELFADTEESYLENLRAKHEEVIRLLRDAQERNQLLDRMNSELLQLTNDLEELAQERTIIEMSLRIADRIRNPATVIGGLARQVLRRAGLDESTVSKLRQIVSQADRIDGILHQFHRMAAERHNLFTQISLPTLVREAIQGCPIIRQRRVHPILAGLEQDIRIHANRKILRVAIVHVLRQAATATPRDGRIFITAGEEGQTVFLTVTGQDQASGREARACSGAGGPEGMPGQVTGLTLVRQIMAEHRGSLHVGKAEQGCRYRLEFPRTWHEGKAAGQ